MTLAAIFDTETNDLDDPKIIEAAYLVITPSGEVESQFCQRYNPGEEISFDAMAVHHILQEEVDFQEPCAKFRLPDVCYLIGHNVDFDWKAYEASGCPPSSADLLICTAAMGRYLWPGIKGKLSSQSSLLYRLLGPPAREMLQGAHSALIDVQNNLVLLQLIIKEAIRRQLILPLEFTGEEEFWSSVYRFSETARLPTIQPFGKHAGVAIKDLPRDYKQWMLKQADMDPYLLKAVRESL